MESRKVLALVAVILIAILWGVSCGVGVYYQWSIEKDTNAWLDRAQVSSNPIDMQNYLIKCREGLDKWDVTNNHAAIVWKTPQNYMPLVVEALDNSIERCEYMKEFERESIEYQVSLDDVRGQLRELDLNTPYSWWAKHVMFLLWIWLGWIAMSAMIIAWVLYDEGY